MTDRRRVREVFTSYDDDLAEADATARHGALLRQDDVVLAELAHTIYKDMQATAAPGTSMGTGTRAPGTPIPRGADGMWSKESVNYRYSADPSFACGTCTHFDRRGACQLVRGMIRPVDRCDLWTPRPGAAAAHYDDDMALPRKESTTVLTQAQRRQISKDLDECERLIKALRQRYGAEPEDSPAVEAFRESYRGNGTTPKIRPTATASQTFRDSMR